MKRSNFLKSLATFIAAPSLIENIEVKEKGAFDKIRQYPLGTKDCYTPIEFSSNKGYYNTVQIMRIYEETGNLFYENKP